MRDLLTALAIVLIVALTAALVGPYLVDWNSQRAFLETRLSHTLGQKVTVGGRIDLKLLPTPYLVLDQTVIGGDDGPVRIGIRHLNLELSITPLLHGEFDIIEAHLQEPTLRITLQPGRRLPAIRGAPAFDADLRFDRIVVNDGTIAISDGESGQTLVIDHLNVTAEAPSLAGPFKGNGSAGSSDNLTKFRFASTIAQKGIQRLHLTIDENPSHAGADFEGGLTFARFDSKGIEPAFDGTITLSGRLSDTNSNGFAWSLTGPLKIDPHSASVEGGTFRLSKDDAAVSLDASGRLSFQEQPKFALSLSAKQLNLDSLLPAGTSDDSSLHVPPLAAIQKILPTARSDLDLDVASATFRGEALSDITARSSFAPKGAASFSFKGSGPEGSRIALDGATRVGSKTTGSFELAADNASNTAKWLSTIDANTPISNSGLPFEKILAKGTYNATPTDVTINNLSLAFDRSQGTGSARLVYGDKKTPSRLIADVKAKALDLDTLPSLDRLATVGSALDLQLSFDANTVKVSQFGEGDIATGHLRFDLIRSAQNILLKDFHADDIGGATISGNGRVDKNSADFSLAVDAAKLDDVANALSKLAPGQLSDAFKAQAPSLVPANLKVAASFTHTTNGSFQPTRLLVNGKLSSTAVDLALSPDKEDSQTFSLKAEASAPQGHTLLAQLGLHTLPLDLLGPGHIALDTHGSTNQPLETHLEGSFGETRFSAQGQVKVSDASLGGSGTVSIKSMDIGPMLQSLAIAFPDFAGRIPLDIVGGLAMGGTGVAFSDLKGSVGGEPLEGGLKWENGQSDRPALSGSFDFQRLSLPSVLGLALGPPQLSTNDSTFSNAPFETGLIDPPRCTLKLRAKTLDLGQGFTATRGAFDLQISPNVINIKKLAADFRQGHVSGNLTIRRDGPQGAIEGTITAEGVDVASPAGRGRLTAHLDLAGSGRNAAALVSSLAGSGDATIKDLRIDGANPAALSRVFDAIERDEVSIDVETVTRAYNNIAVEPLSAGDRQFHLGLASGTLRLDNADASAPSQSVSSQIDGLLDLNRSQVRTATTETLQALPRNWSGSAPSVAIVWSGPFGGPTRQVNVTNLVNAVAARALARETARLDAYEFDIRERSLFNTRLSSEHRREADQLKAEDDARTAEAARRAAKKAAADKAAQDAPAEPRSLPGQNDTSPRFQTAPSGAAADPSSAGRY